MKGKVGTNRNMLICDACGATEELKVCGNCKSTFCSRCLGRKRCKTCGNIHLLEIENEDIAGFRVNYIKLKNLKLGLCGFKRINQNVIDIIKEIKEVEYAVKTKIILFPNKSESIKFSKVFYPTFDENAKNIYKSKFSQIFVDTSSIYTLFNMENIKPSEIPFLIEFLYLTQSKIEPLIRIELPKYIKLIQECLNIYNKRMGINFVDFDEEEFEISKILMTNLLSSYVEYFIYRDLSQKYDFEFLEYIEHKLDLNHSIFMEKHITMYFSDLFEIISHLIFLKTIESSILNKRYRERISKKVYTYINEVFSKLHNKQVANILNEFIKDFNGETLSSYPAYFSFIESWLKKIHYNIPLVFIRYKEALHLMKKQIELIRNNQNTIFINAIRGIQTRIMPKYKESIEYIYEIDNIIHKKIPMQIKLILLHSKIHILQELIYNTEDENLLSVLEKDVEKFSKLLIENFDKIEKDNVIFPIKKWDIILIYNGLSQLYYLFNKNNKFVETVNKNRELLYEYNAPDPLKISVLSLHFHVFEDYEDLLEITKLCYKGEFSGYNEERKFFSDILIESICKFSSFIIENKGDLKKVVDVLEVEPIQDEFIVSDFYRKTGTLNFFNAILHLKNAYMQNSDVLMLSELEMALQYINRSYEVDKRFINSYYLLKTKCIIYILKNDKKSVEEAISKLENYKFKTVKAFKEILSCWLESHTDDELKRIELMEKIWEGYDPWHNLISKIIRKNIKSNVYRNIKNELNSLREISGLWDQLRTFKQIVERDCIDMFWKSRVRQELKPHPEEIAHGLLYVYLSATGAYSTILSEPRVGVGKCDLFLISESKKSIIEVKVIKSRNDIETGINELIYYTKKVNVPEGYLVLFDIRKKSGTIESEIKRDGKTIKVISIKIYEEAPSKN